MMLVRYQSQIVGLVGATRYDLIPEFEEDCTEADGRRVTAVCEWALEVRQLTGKEPGRLGDDVA